MARVLALLVLCAAPAIAIAQPHRPAPAPAVAPAPPPLPPKVKPTPVYEACFGPLVFLTSKTWRECCILCDAGYDAPSAEEKAEAEAAQTCNQNTTVVNQYFSVAGRSIYGGNNGNANGNNGGGNNGGGGGNNNGGGGGNNGNGNGNNKPPSPFARNDSGSLNGLRPLAPRAGGFE